MGEDRPSFFITYFGKAGYLPLSVRQSFCLPFRPFVILYGSEFVQSNFHYSFQWILMKLCKLSVGIFKTGLCSFVGDKIILDEITALKFSLFHFGQLLHHTVWSLYNQLSVSFQWENIIPCINFVDITKRCMWSFDGDNINFHRITAFLKVGSCPKDDNSVIGFVVVLLLCSF